MSIIRIVECDECARSGPDAGASNADAAREAARQEGWMCGAKGDLCPDCKPIIAKLTQAQVNEIRARYHNPKGRVSTDTLAREYGVSQHSIWRVVQER